MKEQILELYYSKKNYYTKYIKQDKKMISYLNKTFRWTKDIKEQVYCLRNNIFVSPKCKYKGCRKKQISKVSQKDMALVVVVENMVSPYQILKNMV
ncbi:MAG: hypothetical protein U9Q83_02670 [Bacteroidota bacterium]|nr:hypothetical protein [Bacteroidota bacterium]